MVPGSTSANAAGSGATTGSLAGVGGGLGSTGTTLGSTTQGAGGGPGAVVDPPPSLLGDVEFSVASGTFEGQLSVGMNTLLAGAEIRYTTDRTLPSPAAQLYSGTPLPLTQTTELRARAFIVGVATGLPSTALYIQRTFDASSEIPLLVVEGYAQGKPTKSDRFEAAIMTFEPTGGNATLSQPAALAARASYRLRGQLSHRFQKAPYRVELWSNTDEDADYAVLGMPPEADWALIGPYIDRTLIRNALVYRWGRDMGLSSMRLAFAEVYVNQDAGPLEASDYQGVYAVTEVIKNQKHRVNLEQLTPADTMLPAISGGYIFKFEEGAVDEGDTTLACTGSEPWGMGRGMSSGHCFWDLVVADPEPIVTQQLAWLNEYIQAFHDGLHAQPIGNYAQFVDVQSFVDHFIVNEITRDIDAYTRSSYYHKDRDDVIKAGPLWDYNIALNSIADPIDGWQWQDGRTGNNGWFRVLGQNPDFMGQVATRYRALRLGMFSDAAVGATIAELSAPLVNAGPRDMALWPADGYQFTEPGLERFAPRGPLTWEGQVEALREWIVQRLAWLDTQLL